MVSLNAPVTLGAIQGTAQRAWRWWTGELLDWVPPSLRNRVTTARPLVLLYTDGVDAALYRTDGAVPHRLAQIALSDRASDLEEARRALAELRRPRVVLCLGEKLMLRRDVELPRSAEPNLRDILRLDFDRQTPFTPERAVFDVAVCGRDPEAERISVKIATVKRETVDASIKLCGDLGVAPERIAIADEGGEPEFDLVQERAQLRFRPQEHPILLAGLAVAILLTLNFGLALWRMDARIALLSVELAKARKEAQTTETLRAKVTQNGAATRLLAEATAHPSALQTLDALTRALPDDVWLFNFELSDGSGQIAGFAPSAAALIGKLDGVAGVVNPRFKAPVTRAGDASADRFEIGFDLAAGSAK